MKTFEIKALLLPPEGVGCAEQSISSAIAVLTDVQNSVPHSISKDIDCGIEAILEVSALMRCDMQRYFDNAVTLYTVLLEGEAFPIKEWLKVKTVTLEEVQKIIKSDRVEFMCSYIAGLIEKNNDNPVGSSVEEGRIIVEFLKFLSSETYIGSFHFLMGEKATLKERFSTSHKFLMFLVSALLGSKERYEEVVDLGERTFAYKLLFHFYRLLEDNRTGTYLLLRFDTVGVEEILNCTDAVFDKVCSMGYNTPALQAKYEQQKLQALISQTMKGEIQKI